MELRLLRHCEGGPYVEFNVSGDATQYQHWSEDSLYLPEDVFGLIDAPFQKAAADFNYYGPTCYAGDQLVELERGLRALNVQWAGIATEAEFTAAMSAHHMGVNLQSWLEANSPSSMYDWSATRAALVQIIAGLAELAGDCRQRGSVLWVLGI